MNLSKKLTLALLIFFCIILSACAVKSSDEMSVDNNFKGTRSIHIEINDKNANFFSNGRSGIVDFLKKNVSAPLTLSLNSENKDKIDAQIVLNFESLNDYIDKVKHLYKHYNIGEMPKTEFKSSFNNIFIKGVYFYDDVTSKKLLKGLIDKAISEKLIDKENIDKILPPSNYNFKYNGKNLISSGEKGPYQINNYEYFGPSKYILSTSMEDKNLWNRVFTVVFPLKNLDQLKSKGIDWKKHLVKNSDINVVKEQEIEEDGSKALLYKFSLDKQSIKTIEKVSSTFLQANSSIDLSINKNPKTFSINYNISEKIDNFQNDDKVSITSVYYTRPKDSSMHYPSSSLPNKELSTIKDAIIVEKKDLLEGYKATKEIKAKFSKAEITTTISPDKNLTRKITIIKGSDFYADMGSELISSYLSKNNIQASDDSKTIAIKYGPKDFENKNSLFFNKNPNIKVSQAGIFGYKIEYSDNSSFSKFSVDEVVQNFISPNLSRSSEKKISFMDNSFDNQISISGTKISNILIFLITLLSFFILIFLLIRLIKKYRQTNKLNLDKESNAGTFTTNKKDTQPIPIINDSNAIVENKEYKND